MRFFELKVKKTKPKRLDGPEAFEFFTKRLRCGITKLKFTTCNFEKIVIPTSISSIEFYLREENRSSPLCSFTSSYGFTWVIGNCLHWSLHDDGIPQLTYKIIS